MALFNFDIKFDGTAIKSCLHAIAEFFKGIWNQPTWLKVLVGLAIAIGATYYCYNYFNRNESIKELEKEVEIINEKINGNLSEDVFTENLIYVITEIQLLQQEEDLSYTDELVELDLLITILLKYHPTDPAINDLQAMKTRLEVNHNAYKQHYEYVMKQLIKLTNESNAEITK